MFRVHVLIIRSIRCWDAAYGFLHRVFGWVVVSRAAADGALHGTIRTVHTTYAELSRPPPIEKLGAENQMLQLNI